MSKIFYHISHLKKMQLEFKKLVFDPKVGTILEFSTPLIGHIDRE